MAVTDIATRTYDHGFRLDPIVRSLLDTDFYKLLMLQMIRHLHPKVQTTFTLINRTTSVRLADIIDEGELRAQLDHARTVRAWSSCARSSPSSMISASRTLVVRLIRVNVACTVGWR